MQLEPDHINSNRLGISPVLWAVGGVKESQMFESNGQLFGAGYARYTP